MTRSRWLAECIPLLKYDANTLREMLARAHFAL